MADELAPVAVVLTQIATPEALAAVCALQRLDVDAVPTPIGAVAVCRDAAPGAAADVARALSTTTRGVPALLLVQRDGQIAATRWTAGEQGDALAPGLVLDGAPAVVERLLLGGTTAADEPGVVSAVGMSRWKATRTLASVARAARRGPRPAP